jgi:hypothetical protein
MADRRRQAQNSPTADASASVRTWSQTVIDENVLLNPELRVPALKVADPVLLQTMAQRQVLSPSRRTNRISLNKAAGRERASK